METFKVAQIVYFGFAQPREITTAFQGGMGDWVSDGLRFAARANRVTETFNGALRDGCCVIYFRLTGGHPDPIYHPRHYTFSISKRHGNGNGDHDQSAPSLPGNGNFQIALYRTAKFVTVSRCAILPVKLHVKTSERPAPSRLQVPTLAEAQPK